MFSCSIIGRRAVLPVILFAVLCGPAPAQRTQQTGSTKALPRMVDGKPNFQGIWQVSSKAAYDLRYHAASLGMPAGKGVVEGGEIPYQPWAAAKKQENFANRQTADPVGKCYLPGVPRVMYLEFPFQIFQTSEHIAMTFEWNEAYRLIRTTGKPPLHDDVDSWMGDSRGRWEGDTLVVDVTGQNDRTWFDMAGNFHSDALHLIERYTMLNADTIQYEVAVQDPKVFTKPWKMSMPLVRQKNIDRILEYQCQAEAEEASGAFERDSRTWYPGPGSERSPLETKTAMRPGGSLPALKPGVNFRRTADGKPDLTGFYQADAGGSNYGLERHPGDFLTPAARGTVIDPADGSLPYQPWARAERIDRELPYRGYDDPTAHCFPP